MKLAEQVVVAVQEPAIQGRDFDRFVSSNERQPPETAVVVVRMMKFVVAVHIGPKTYPCHTKIYLAVFGRHSVSAPDALEFE